MYTQHQNECKGDFSFMEDLLPSNVKAFHMDSYITATDDRRTRFQGAFYVSNNKHIGSYSINECPLAILELAFKYQINTCNCLSKGRTHLTWTIWFKTEDELNSLKLGGNINVL